jgi:phage tail-like protein
MPRTFDGFPAFNFEVEIAGISAAPFSGLDVLDVSTGVIETRYGGDELVRKLPGRHRASNITLRRPYTATHDLHTWYVNIRRGIMDRRSGSVVIRDVDRQTEVARFNFFEAWPTRWRLSTFDADVDALLVEEVEVACERIELATS